MLWKKRPDYPSSYNVNFEDNTPLLIFFREPLGRFCEPPKGFANHRFGNTDLVE
jgi:hypothetical protein